MYSQLSENIARIIGGHEMAEERKLVLQPLVTYIQEKVSKLEPVNLNFICTHNSRRSHLSQVWAQVAAFYYNITRVFCYSGGTETTALFPKIAETLTNQGFFILKLSDDSNPVYAIKYDSNCEPVIGFSKNYDLEFNLENSFVAIMTCSQADGGCPFIAGAEKRVAITYKDPKSSDGTLEQTETYHNRSLEIGSEMFYIFSQIKK